MSKGLKIFLTIILIFSGLIIFCGRKETAQKPKEAAPAGTTAAPKPDASEGLVPRVPTPEGFAPINIGPDKQQLIGVTTDEVAVKPFVKTIRAVGWVDYREPSLFTVNAKFEGWAEKLYVDYTGQLVKKGQPLLEIYSPELVSAQEEYLLARKAGGMISGSGSEEVKGDAASLLSASRRKLELWDISGDQIAGLEKSGTAKKTLTLNAPSAGFVIEKGVSQGDKIMSGQELYKIADLSQVWVYADIYENEIPLIKVGQMARIGLSYFPGQEFSSPVDYIYPSLAGDIRTAKARFTIPNPDGVLKPQMFTNVEIKINLGSRLAIPTAAVIDTGVRQIVYVDRGEGNFEPREVVPGLRSEDMVEIIRGLRAGEQVAASANFLIDSEAQLKGVAPLPLRRK